MSPKCRAPPSSESRGATATRSAPNPSWGSRVSGSSSRTRCSSSSGVSPRRRARRPPISTGTPKASDASASANAPTEQPAGLSRDQLEQLLAPIALYPDDGADAETLIKNADTAMYEAKSAGRGRCVLFTGEMRHAERERAELASELARAITDRRLTIDYQPLFSTVTQQAVGADQRQIGLGDFVKGLRQGQ